MQVTIDTTTMALWEFQGRYNKKKEREGFGTWTRADIELMVERVNRGAALLDERKPGWNFKVVPENLDMTDNSLCIVGQSYGSYGQFVGPVFGWEEEEENEEVTMSAIDHGFLTNERWEYTQNGIDESEAYGGFIPWALMDRVWSYFLIARAEQDEPLTLVMPKQESLEVQLERLLADKLVTREEALVG